MDFEYIFVHIHFIIDFSLYRDYKKICVSLNSISHLTGLIINLPNKNLIETYINKISNFIIIYRFIT